jgi:hypothetical protein
MTPRPPSAALPVAALVLLSAAATAARAELALKKTADTLEITRDGKPLTTYRFSDKLFKPHFWPIIGPTGAPVTRGWPNDPDAKDDTRDHVHHRGLHLTHEHIEPEGKTAFNNWMETGKPAIQGRSVHRKFDPEPAVADGGKAVTFGAVNEWVGPDGAAAVTERAVWTILDHGEGGVEFRVTYTLSPAGGADAKPVRLGDAKDAGFAVRVAGSMDEAREKNDPRPPEKRGHITNSAGAKGEKGCWAKFADWVDYAGPVDGKTVGIAMFDHPDNKPRCRWHVRAYGLFTANPFGSKSLGKDNPEAPVTLKPGEPLILRYGVLIHPGDASEGKVAERFAEFAKSK